MGALSIIENRLTETCGIPKTNNWLEVQVPTNGWMLEEDREEGESLLLPCSSWMPKVKGGDWLPSKSVWGFRHARALTKYDHCCVFYCSSQFESGVRRSLPS